MSDFEPVKIMFDNGEVTSRPKEYLEPGELTLSIGAEYRLRGDAIRIHRIPGRVLFGTVAGGLQIDGLKICRFDDMDSDRLLVMTVNGLFVALVSGAGTFSQIGDARSGQKNDRLSAAHVNDSWFIVVKSPLRTANQNTVLLSDGTTRPHGMKPPKKGPDLAETAGLDPGQVIEIVTVDVNSIINPDPAEIIAVPPIPVQPFEDPENVAKILPPLEDENFAVVRFESTSFQIFIIAGASWGFDDVGNGLNRDQRHVEIRYMVTNWGIAGQPLTRTADIPTTWLNYSFALSEDAGASYTNASGSLYAGKTPDGNVTFHSDIQSAVFPVFLNQDIVLNNQLRVSIGGSFRGPTTQSSPTLGIPASCDFRIYSIRILGEDESVTTELDKHVQYAFTEYSADYGLESEPSPSEQAILNGANGVVVTFPPPVNSITTHYRLYRTPEFSVTDPNLIPTRNEVLSRLGYVHDVRIPDAAQDPRVIRDSLEFFNRQTYPVIELVSIAQGDGSVAYFPANHPPPPLTQVSAFKNSLVGISGRSWFRSLPAQPDKWPSVLGIDSLPLEENDTLVACLQLNESLIIAANGVILAIDEMPKVQNRIFVPPNPRKVAEVGLVNQDAITTISQGKDREDLCAWVSHHGIHITNGYTSRTITDDIDWSENVVVENLDYAVLDFDIQTLQLKFSYDVNRAVVGLNSRFALIHMAPFHQKKSGLPRITWGHYGTIQSLDSQILSGELASYSGSAAGKVYIERVGTTDESNSYDSSGTIPFRVGIHLNGEWQYLQAYRGNLRNNASSPIGMTIRVNANLETYDEVQTIVESVTINGRPVNFLIDRAGESFDVTFEVDDQGDFSMVDCRILLGRGDIV